MAVLARISHEQSLIEHLFGSYRVIQAGMNLDWINQGGAPVLDTHMDRSIKHKVGTIRRAFTRGMETFVVWDWEAWDFARETRERVERGDLRYVSMSFQVVERLRLIQVEEGGAEFLMTSTEPVEVSVVSQPADRQAAILDVDYQEP